jgi:hypothetical protein
MKRLAMLALLLCPAWAQATIHVFTSDSLPRTLGPGYEDDTIQFSGTSVSTLTDAFLVNAPRVTILGANDTIFYGRGGGNSNHVFDFTSAGDTLKCYDLRMIHDPQNDGHSNEWDDTSFNGLFNTAVSFNDNGNNGSAPVHAEFRRCKIVTYGQDVHAYDSYGNGVGTKNIIIDSNQIWQMSDTYTSRHSYGGAGIRFEIRGSFLPGQWAARITNTVIRRSSHAGIIVLGKSDAQGGPQYAFGTIISRCSTYVDAVNDGPATEDNAYGILLKSLGSGSRCDSNYVSNGTLRSGSRGILVENCVGKIDTVISVSYNRIVATAGPTGENPPGVTRSLRFRSLDGGGTTDYLHVHHNSIEVLTDTLTSTKHIGANASGLQFTIQGVRDQGNFHVILENNRSVYRPMTAGTDGNAGEFCVFNDYVGVPPITMRNNAYISGERCVWLADEFNAGSADNLTFFRDTLGYLPGGDSGLNQSDRITWKIGYYNENSLDNQAVNAYYKNGALDTNVVFHLSGPGGEFTEIQRINVSAVGTDDSLVATAGIKVWNGNGLLVLDDPALSLGHTTFDFRYFHSFGLNGGTDSNFNKFDVWVWSGSDTTKLNDTTINWQVTCLPVHLAATSGTLDASDTCEVVAAENGCVEVTPVSPLNGATVADLTPDLVLSLFDTDGETVDVVLIGEPGDATPEDTLADTVLVMSDNWIWNWGALSENVNYYWYAIARDTGDCADTTPIFQFLTDSLPGSPTSGFNISYGDKIR